MAKRWAILILMSLISMVAWAMSSPVDMLQSTTDQMISALQANKATIKSNPNFVYGLARKILLPHIDAPTMARLALGPTGWSQATPTQQQQFVQEFTTLMIRTYSSALASYNDQKIQYAPMRGDYSTKKQVQVNSKIIQSGGGPAIPVVYRLVLRNNQWLVYDFSVDGISMVQSFRSQFTQQLQKNGMEGLLATINAHNDSRGKQ